ncbi:MAG TPA: hypothetical protein VMR50_06960 [Myxococcota bacterium]|nr:hypothetical protein [Myxococcota bacterium]
MFPNELSLEGGLESSKVSDPLKGEPGVPAEPSESTSGCVSGMSG